MASKSARTRSAAKRAPAPDTTTPGTVPTPGTPPAPGAAPTLDGTADGEPLQHARKITMFVDSTIHLPGEEDKDGRQRAPVVVTGGRTLDEVQDDLDEKLTDDQIDELIALRAIRPATQAEIAAADARADVEE